MWWPCKVSALPCWSQVSQNPLPSMVPGEIWEAKVRQRPFLCSEGLCRPQVPRQLTYVVSHLLAYLPGVGLQVLGQECVQLWQRSPTSFFSGFSASLRLETMRHAGTGCSRDFRFVFALPYCTPSSSPCRPTVTSGLTPDAEATVLHRLLQQVSQLLQF